MQSAALRRLGYAARLQRGRGQAVTSDADPMGFEEDSAAVRESLHRASWLECLAQLRDARDVTREVVEWVKARVPDDVGSAEATSESGSEEHASALRAAFPALELAGFSTLQARNARNLAAILAMRRGDLPLARELLEAAARTCEAEARRGNAHDSYVDVGGVLNDLASLSLLEGRAEEALRFVKRALFVAKRAYRPSAHAMGALHCTRGLALLAQAKPKEAREALESSEAFLAPVVGTGDLTGIVNAPADEVEPADIAAVRTIFALTAARAGLARALLSTERSVDGATAAAERAVEGVAQVFGPDSRHPAFAEALATLGVVQARGGQFGRARKVLEYACSAFVEADMPCGAMAAAASLCAVLPASEVLLVRERGGAGSHKQAVAALRAAERARDGGMGAGVEDGEAEAEEGSEIVRVAGVLLHNEGLAQGLVDRGMGASALHEGAFKVSERPRMVAPVGLALGVALADFNFNDLQWRPGAELGSDNGPESQ